jgi:hypothetical protein
MEFMSGKRNDIGWEYDEGWMFPDDVETVFFTEVE